MLELQEYKQEKNISELLVQISKKEGYESAKSYFTDWRCSEVSLDKKDINRVFIKMAEIANENSDFDFVDELVKIKFKDNMNLIFVKGKNFISDLNVSKFQITQKLFEKVMNYNPSFFKGENNPVENISWLEAIQFCNEASKRNGLIPCYSIEGNNVTCNFCVNGFRLPTVEEWKYLASCEDNFYYSGSNNISEVAWFEENSEGQTHTVGQKRANSYGLYDMSGNVYEWCYDFIRKVSSNSYQSYHSALGGCFSDSLFSCNLSNDTCYGDSNFKNKTFGFRVVQTIGNFHSTSGSKGIGLKLISLKK